MADTQIEGLLLRIRREFILNSERGVSRYDWSVEIPMSSAPSGYD